MRKKNQPMRSGDLEVIGIITVVWMMVCCVAPFVVMALFGTSGGG